MKFIFKFILVTIALFITFITEEAIRLKCEEQAIPVVITDRTKYCIDCIRPGETLEVEYMSLGYKVKMNYYLSDKHSNDNKVIEVTKKEFLLFNKYRLWIIEKQEK